LRLLTQRLLRFGVMALLAPKFRGWLLTFFAAASGWGCVSKPTMHLNHAEISGAQLAVFPPSIGILMTVVVDVYNPNSYDVAIRAMRGQVVMGNNGYSLPVDYRAPGNGVWLAADRTTSVRVPVSVPLDLGIALLRESVASPFIPYRLTGRADVTGSNTFRVEADDYAVDEQGTISRDQIAAIIPNSIGVPRPM
jgi:Late embryogenesis abundant protein